MEEIIQVYEEFLRMSEPGTPAATAYSVVIDQLKNAASVFSAKNHLHTYELFASTSEVKLIFQAARYRLEHLLQEQRS